MQLPRQRLTAHLAERLAPLYVLHGDEPLLVAEAGDEIRRAARQRGFADRTVLVAGGSFRWDELAAAGGNLSLFGGNTFIDLRIPSGKPGRDGAEALQRHAAHVGEGVLTLVSLPRLDWATRKAGWFLALQEAGVAVEANAPDLARLPDWIGERLARQGQRAGREALRFIAGYVEGNLLAAHQEIQKLALLYPAGELGLDQVEEAVLRVARYDVEKLRAALLAGDAVRCARLIDGLQGEGAAPPLVLWAVSAEVRGMATLRTGLDAGQSAAEVLRRERVGDERRRQGLMARAARLTTAQLQQALAHAARIDRIIKGLSQGDVWDELLQLVLRVARP